MARVPTSTGWPLVMTGPDLLYSAAELDLRRLVDDVGMVDAHHRLVGGDDHHVQVIDLRELFGLGLGGAGHARQAAIHAEIVLEGDGGQREALALDPHALLGLDRLVQPLGVAPTVHQAPGELVDDDHLAVRHDIVAIARERAPCALSAFSR